MTFNASAPGATNFNWLFPIDWIPNAGSGITFTSTPGSSGNITVTPSNSFCIGTPGSKSVTIKPLIGVVSISGNSSGCAGSIMTFTASAANASDYFWSAPADWSPNSGQGTNFTTTPGSSGNITATPRNGSCVGMAGSKFVTFTALPGPATISGTNTGSPGIPLTFTASAANATNYTWTAPMDWTPWYGQGTTFTTTPGSTGQVMVSPTNICGTACLEWYMSIFEFLHTQLLSHPKILLTECPLLYHPLTRMVIVLVRHNFQGSIMKEPNCYNATQTITVAGNGTNFHVLNGGVVKIIAGQKITFLPNSAVDQGGYMNAYITTTNTYCNSTPSISLKSLGEDEQRLPDKSKNSIFKVYPNPTSGKFTLEFLSNQEPSSALVRVYNLIGTEILKNEILKFKKTEIDLQYQSPGLYFVSVILNGKMEVIKIVKGTSQK